MSNIREKTISILEGMKYGTLEREEAMALCLLSAMAGESIFLLGLPGVGKSMIARRLKTAFENAAVFEYLMSRFSTPDEIFGPVSISKLKDEDKYERVTTGFLPEAEVVFLVEIWKAGPAIQNSLLTVLNEKIYLNGNTEIRLPLKGVIAASNELPAKDESLEALWDRFLIRYIVNPISRPDNFRRLLTLKNDSLKCIPVIPFSREEYEAIRIESKEIEIPDTILDCMSEIHDKLSRKANKIDPDTGDVPEENGRYYVSDRRWKKCIGILQTSAYLNGRSAIDMSDMLLLSHMLWNDDSTIMEIRDITAESIMSVILKRIMDGFKSQKRHVAQKKVKSGYFSPDGKSYQIDCDGSPLKILKSDYEMIKKDPSGFFFGSETTDGFLIISNGGEFVIKFVKDGILSINGFSYPLMTISDRELGNSFLDEAENIYDSTIRGLFADIESNIFTSTSSMILSLQSLTTVFRTRFKQLR